MNKYSFRIVEANFKWKQAQLMVDYAYKQLKEAVKQWMLLPNINSQNLEERYSIRGNAGLYLADCAKIVYGLRRKMNVFSYPKS